MPSSPATSPALNFEQQELGARLARLGSELSAGEHPRGLYLHGSVGRGKTWLCDRFFEQLPTTRKRRVHFHSFFRGLHRDIWKHRIEDPEGAAHAVDRAVASLLDGVDLLYFDEFHVHDSGDAALVLRVLDDVLAGGVTLLATSNYAPQELLPGPFHHVFERGIRMLEENLDIVQLGGDRDYRRDGASLTREGFGGGSWLAPGTDDQLDAVGLTRPAASEHRQLPAGGHRFSARRAAGRQVWFSFAELCERETAVSDYLHWLADYDTWVVDEVPRPTSTTVQAARRFANLVDVLCDRDVTLHLLSAHPPSAMFEGSRLPLDSERTASRLALLQNVDAIHTQR